MRLSTSEEIPSTTVGRTASPNIGVVNDAYDVTRMREEEFERLTVYIVPDVPCERGVSNRAERTLPRSLALRPSAVLSTPNTPTEGVWSTGVIPRGTRFGPFEGTRTPNKPNDKVSWRYYWRVQETVRHHTYGNIKIFKDSDYYYLDGSDTSVANWMRYVASAYSLSVMNLVACQHQEHIYFYTIRDILPNEELMVWYCKDFATRLGYDIDPERATYSICKEETIKKAYGLPPAPVHPEIAFNHMKYVLGLTNTKEMLETDLSSRRIKRESTDKNMECAVLSRENPRLISKSEIAPRIEISNVIQPKMENPHMINEHRPVSPSALMQPPSPKIHHRDATLIIHQHKESTSHLVIHQMENPRLHGNRSPSLMHHHRDIRGPSPMALHPGRTFAKAATRST